MEPRGCGELLGPSIDAPNDGATKFHIGGVLKVKIGEEGLSVHGASVATCASSERSSTL